MEEFELITDSPALEKKQAACVLIRDACKISWEVLEEDDYYKEEEDGDGENCDTSGSDQ